jgi:hypothetical protein
MPDSDDAQEQPSRLAGQTGREPAMGEQISAQGRAYRVLGQLLDRAAAENLPAIDWTVAASGARVLGRCTAFPGPGQRRADFEAWRAVLGTDASEAAASREVTRLAVRAERDNGLVTVEVVADLYDDLSAGHRSSDIRRTP